MDGGGGTDDWWALITVTGKLIVGFSITLMGVELIAKVQGENFNIARRISSGLVVTRDRWT